MADEIATYTFLPWLRQGMASKIKQPDSLNGPDSGTSVRSSVRLGIQVNGDADFASGDVQLTGPGDVIGLSPRAIVRTEPRNWVTDFEPNYLACIEFKGKDFLWRYTPAAAVEKDSSGAATASTADTKLRPWLFLMVLEEAEFDSVASAGGSLPVVKLKENPANDVFPPPEQSWAWAHAHVSQDITDNNEHTTEQAIDKLEAIVRDNADAAYCRLICPRKLRPQTGYHAFVIPAFEVGRLAGLGQPTEGVDVLKASWGDGRLEYPIYHQWYFRTGERGDFEYLVNLLEARPVDKRVGIRDLDMQHSSFGVEGMTDGPGDLTVMGLEGALKSPESEPRPTVWPPATHPAFLKQLVDKVNLQDTLLEPPGPGANHPDPVISPPLYGRWHALQRRLNVGEAGWVNELSEDPRNRVAAGMGTQVIQTHQETYMQKAWQQLGDVLRANQKIRQAQLAIAVSFRFFSQHLVKLKTDQQIVITAQVHKRVLGSPTTIFQRVSESQLPQAALSPAFRRMLRPRGALMRKAVPNSNGKPTDLLEQLNNGTITAATPKEAPQKLISVDGLVPSWLPEWLRNALASPYAGWVLLLLVVLIGVGLLVEGVSVPSVVVAAFSVGGVAYVNRLRKLVQTADNFRLENLTTQAIKQISPRPQFKLIEPDQTSSTVSQAGAVDSPEAANFRTALLDLHARFEAPLPQPVEKAQLDFDATSMKLVKALNPVHTIPRRFTSIVTIPKTFKYLRAVESIVPIMAHPVFSDPMYKPLRDISSELLVPNLNLIPNNTITLMETNPRFIEAYMVGLNHEMARELLWQAYLTDQRGSYFRQFWDVGEVVNRDEEKDRGIIEEELRDIAPIHTWGKQTPLGSHKNRLLPTGRESDGESKLVLVIRGDVLKKYPTALFYAQKAKWEDDGDDNQVPPRKIRVLDETNPAENRREPIFKAQIEPNVMFVGFSLTATEAKGSATPPDAGDGPGNPGWFFVVQEHHGDPRFGLDIKNEEPPLTGWPLTEWNDLSWNHLGDPETIKFIDVTANPGEVDKDKNVQWGANAADMAYILYQVPVLVAVHADDLLP